MRNKPLYLRILVVCLMALLTLFCVTACQKETYEINLDKTQLTLSAGTFSSLTATTNKEDAVIEWSSSLESVATVTADGKVYGVDVGVAIITAKYANATATCSVTVEPSEIPVFIEARLNGIADTEYNLYSGDKATLELKLFDGMDEQNCTFSVQSLDTEVVDIENGTLSAKSVGSTTVEFSTTYKGETYKSSITVNVVKTLYISLQKNTLDLSAASEGGEYAHVYDLAPEVYEGSNQLVEDAQIEYLIDNPDVISIEDGVITALKKGKAKITLSYTDEFGFSTSTFAQVTVHLTNKQFAKTILLSKYDFTEKYSLGAEYIEGEVVYCQTTYSDGTVKSSDNAEFLMEEYPTGKYSLIVETTTANYTGEMILADLVIKTKDQLKNWPYYIRPTNWANNAVVEYDGYVVLGDDIDYGGDEYYNELAHALATNVTEGFVEISKTSDSLLWHSNSKTPSGELQTASGYKPKFIGTFDGLGHCISNIKFVKAGMGLFGTYCPGTVKNLAITGINITGYRKGAICFEFAGAADGLFLEGSLHSSNLNTGLLSAKCSGKISLKRVSAVLSEGVNRTDAGILIGSALVSDTSSTLIGYLYGIGNVGHLVYKSSGNIHDAADGCYKSGRAENLAAFVAAKHDISVFTSEYWNTKSGFPIMQSAIGKLTKINLQATDNASTVVTKVAAGESVNIGIKKYQADTSSNTYTNNQAGFSTITVNAIDGVSYSNGILTVAQNVAAGTQITLTATNMLDGATSTLTLIVK